MILLVDHQDKKQDILIVETLLKLSSLKSSQDFKKNTDDGRRMEECEYYIHDTFIATGGWQESAWDGLMSLLVMQAGRWWMWSIRSGQWLLLQ